LSLPIQGILLCAGASTRFGGDKLLAPVSACALGLPGDRMPMAGISAATIISAVGSVLAVVRPGHAELRALLAAKGCEVLETDRALRGIGASIAAAVEATGDAEGWLIALGDMPFVTPATMRAVSQALAAGALIATPVDEHGRRGHPVGFSRALRAELVALDGDEGARALIARHSSSITKVPVEDPGIFVDIDTRDDMM
jgi:molybdenum cofactor cytidylyltransferase